MSLIIRITVFLFLFSFPLLLPLPGHSLGRADFLYEFGSQGEEKGRLREPRALTVSEGGDIYVADTENHRIQAFRSSGGLLFLWGREGSDPGEFDSPSGIAFGNGKIFVADTGNHRIQIFDGKGRYLDSFGRKGSDPKEFRKPEALAFRGGLIYVADTGNNRVQVFTEDGIFVSQINPEKSRTRKLEEPHAISVNHKGEIYVLDRRDQLFVFNRSGNIIVSHKMPGGQAIMTDVDGFYVATKTRVSKYDYAVETLMTFGSFKTLMTFGSEGNGPRTFREISSLGTDPLGNIYVLDSRKNTVQAFSAEKEAPDPRSAERPSSVAYVKDFPAADDAVLVRKNDALFAYDGKSEKFIPLTNENAAARKPKKEPSDTSGDFWIANRRKDRIERHDNGGKFIVAVGERGGDDGQFSDPSALAMSRRAIYVADSGNSRIQIFDAGGKYIGSFGGKGKDYLKKPVALAFDGKENLYIVDEELNKIVKTDSSGNFILAFGSEGGAEGQFAEPKGIAVVGDEVYILDAGNRRVQVFNSRGEYLREFGSEGKGKGEFSEPVSMSVDGDCNLHIHDRGNRRIQVLRLLLTPSQPEAIRADGMVREIKITWAPNPEAHISSYKIFRRQEGQARFEEVGTVESSSSFSKYAYFDKNLKSRTTFHYAVTAVSRTGNESVMSNVLTASTKTLVPSPPKLLKTEAGQKDLLIEWIPSPEPYTDHYVVSRSDGARLAFSDIKAGKESFFRDTGLKPNSLYKYEIVAIGVEGDRSKPLSLEIMTAKLPPIEIAGIETEDVFSNNYKYYETTPLGKIFIKSNSEHPITKVKVSFMVKGYMDYPSEAVIERIEGGQEKEVPLRAVFNNTLLDLTETSALQSEVTVTFFYDGENRTVSLSRPLAVYEKHALLWDNPEKAALFITPKDAVLIDLATEAVSGYGDIPLDRSLLQARAIFEALGIMGITYLQDPNNPYQKVSKNVSLIDYIQYPRETLKRKAGDCDDLVVLYASALESLGIPTAFVLIPGHLFLMFDTSLSSSEKDDFGFPPDDCVIYKGTIWVPVEATLAGSSFTVAWKKGIDTFREWKEKGLEIVDVKDAWRNFKPATLPENNDPRPEAVKTTKIEETFPGELRSLTEQRVNYISSCLLEDPDTSRSLEQIGILYGENGMYQEAMTALGKYVKTRGEDATVLNNIGNIHFLRGDFKSAEKSYLKALKEDPRDPGVMMNLARCFLRQGKKDKAKKFFAMAAAIDPEIEKKYFHLASELKR